MCTYVVMSVDRGQETRKGIMRGSKRGFREGSVEYIHMT